MLARTAFDLVFRNARTRAAAEPIDIGVKGGKIAAIAPELACEGVERTETSLAMGELIPYRITPLLKRGVQPRG